MFEAIIAEVIAFARTSNFSKFMASIADRVLSLGWRGSSSARSLIEGGVGRVSSNDYDSVFGLNDRGDSTAK